MELANLVYVYERRHSNESPSSSDCIATKDQILASIKQGNMTNLYNQLCIKFGWTVDNDLVEVMREENEKELLSIDNKCKDAEKNAGDMEVLDAMFAKARYLSKIGSWEAAYVAYDLILAKDKTSTGKKIDANMEKAKIALITQDLKRIKDTIFEAKKLVEAGGDWDRRNRLKVYEAHYLLSIRDIRQAAKLLLDCIATFTCVELCSYKTFMLYALLTNLICLDRNQLRKKLVQDPHVITAIRELPSAQRLLHGIYHCDYQQFFSAILSVQPQLLDDRFLGPAAVFLVREYRVLAYAQFLEAYKSVMLSSMAASFGLSVALLDAELSRFIAAGRISAKIDKVGDVVETSRPDRKNAQYQEVIKRGDVLLNQVQKLVRVIDV